MAKNESGLSECLNAGLGEGATVLGGMGPALRGFFFFVKQMNKYIYEQQVYVALGKTECVSAHEC